MAIDGNQPKPPAVPRDAPVWIHVALAELGVQEFVGKDTNPRIAEYYKATGLGGTPEDSSTPWCSAFACWVMEYAGYRSTRRANARSWLTWGQALPVNQPRYGAIAVLWRGDPEALTGHVGFYVGHADENRVWLLGGNQANRVGYQLYGTGRLLGFRQPRELDRKAP